MISYWFLLGGVLVVLFTVVRRRLRRQMRTLSQQTTRFDEFSAETIRLRRRSDRAAERLQKGEDEG